MRGGYGGGSHFAGSHFGGSHFGGYGGYRHFGGYGVAIGRSLVPSVASLLPAELSEL